MAAFDSTPTSGGAAKTPAFSQATSDTVQNAGNAVNKAVAGAQQSVADAAAQAQNMAGSQQAQSQVRDAITSAQSQVGDAIQSAQQQVQSVAPQVSVNPTWQKAQAALTAWSQSPLSSQPGVTMPDSVKQAQATLSGIADQWKAQFQNSNPMPSPNSAELGAYGQKIQDAWQQFADGGYNLANVPGIVQNQMGGNRPVLSESDIARENENRMLRDRVRTEVARRTLKQRQGGQDLLEDEMTSQRLPEFRSVVPNKIVTKV